MCCWRASPATAASTCRRPGRSLAPEAIAGFAGRPYAEVAFEVIRPFVGGEIADARPAARCAGEAYAGFRHPAVAPLAQIAPDRLRARAVPRADARLQGRRHAAPGAADGPCARRSAAARVTIVGATSGDTGGAAIEAFRGRDNADVFILFPEGRVSPFQQRQMTTTGAANVHAIAVKGTFDDCQAIVKGMFGNARLPRPRGARRRQLDQLGADPRRRSSTTSPPRSRSARPRRPVSFTVPTGNFGDIFAGYAAKRMGLPIDRLVIATNVNDILARTLATGRYELRGVTATIIAVDGHPGLVEFRAAAVRGLRPRRRGGPPADGRASPVRRLRHRAGGARRDPRGLRGRPRRRGRDRGDDRARPTRRPASSPIRTPPSASRSPRGSREPGVPMVTLATAHPAKFPAAVEAAAGVEPELPDGLRRHHRRGRSASRPLPTTSAAVEDHSSRRAPRAVAEKV